MNPSFFTVGDVFDQNYHWYESQRKKLIHSVAGHGKVSLIARENQPFTGLFQGATEGIVRLSSANSPVLGDAASPLTPGMGLKFLRDGIDSGNLVSMYGVNGTPGEWNYFEHSFSNHIKPAEGAALAAVAKKFSSATDWIQEVGLSDMAMYGQDGVK